HGLDGAVYPRRDDLPPRHAGGPVPPLPRPPGPGRRPPARARPSAGGGPRGRGTARPPAAGGGATHVTPPDPRGCAQRRVVGTRRFRAPRGEFPAAAQDVNNEILNPLLNDDARTAPFMAGRPPAGAPAGA